MAKNVLPQVSKAIVGLKASDLTNNLVSFYMNPDLTPEDILKVRVQLARLEEAMKKAHDTIEIKDVLRKATLDLVDETNKVNIDTAEITYTSTYTEYDFTVCNHPELNFINALIAAFKERKKQIEEELKLISEPKPMNRGTLEEPKIEMVGGTKHVVVDDSIINIIQGVIDSTQIVSGEVVEVGRPRKNQTMGIKIGKK